METNSVTSTSRSSAKCSDVNLRGGNSDDTIRLVFRPELVDNPHDSKAAVRGTFVYQRKGQNDEWESITSASLNSLKKGQGYKLELHAGEVLKLFKNLADLYRAHARDGIPYGTTEYVRADSVIAALMEIPRSDLRQFLTANQAMGGRLLTRLLAWASEIDDPNLLVSRLLTLGDNALRNLNVAAGLGTLKKALSVWQENRDNGKEDFWQKTLTEHSFVLEQVFSWPTTIVKEKAYVGGKSVCNDGGNIVDFLMANYLTKNAALVEIKTPKTPLLGRQYRNTYNMSEDLNGSVMQVLNYRFSLQREFHNLTSGSLRRFQAFEPRCVVIVGTAAHLKGETEKLRALELFRNSCPAVTVITFDELFAKTKRLITVLETAG